MGTKVTSRMIAEEFGVSAQQARTDVEPMEVAPGNAIEKGPAEGYFPITTFTPVLLGDNDLVWRATVNFNRHKRPAQQIPHPSRSA